MPRLQEPRVQARRQVHEMKRLLDWLRGLFARFRKPAFGDTEPLEYKQDIFARSELVPPVPTDVQEMLDRIAVAKADELPPLVTRQVTNWETGEVTVTRQDGTPLSVIDKAIMARADELRRQAGS